MVQNEDIYNIISSSLNNKTSLSIIRVGDGEFIVHKGIDESELSKIPYNKHLGYIPSKKQRKRIILSLTDAVQNCNILGVSRNKGRKWSSSANYFKELRGDKPFCSADFHTWMLHNGFLDLLLSSIDRLVYVSGHTIDFNNRYPNIKAIKHFKIPKQVRYFGQPEERHYPDVYNRIIKDIKIRDFKGWLCLVGAGIAGKPYVIEFSKQGGVAVDIGSVFDLWAGFITRGKNKGKSDLYNLNNRKMKKYEKITDFEGDFIHINQEVLANSTEKNGLLVQRKVGGLILKKEALILYELSFANKDNKILIMEAHEGIAAFISAMARRDSESEKLVRTNICDYVEFKKCVHALVRKNLDGYIHIDNLEREEFFNEIFKVRHKYGLVYFNEGSRQDLENAVKLVKKGGYLMLSAYVNFDPEIGDEFELIKEISNICVWQKK